MIVHCSVRALSSAEMIPRRDHNSARECFGINFLIEVEDRGRKMDNLQHIPLNFWP
jgi:hypothetical protein